jgi:hypothetical protein
MRAQHASAYLLSMKLLRYGDTNAYVGEQTAALLLDYKQLLARRDTADALSLRALVGENHDVCALRVLIGPGSPLRIETPDDLLDVPDLRNEPDNRMTDLFLKERIARLS